MQPPQGYGSPPMPAHQPQGPSHPQYGPPQMPVYQAPGPPYAQYGTPQQRFQPPPKKGKLKWILGALGVATVVIADLEASRESYYSGCRETPEGDGGSARLCISPSEDADTWDVSIELRAK